MRGKQRGVLLDGRWEVVQCWLSVCGKMLLGVSKRSRDEFIVHGDGVSVGALAIVT